MSLFDSLICFSDGGARGNPGPAGLGVVLKSGPRVVARLRQYIGEATNNQAEYQALLLGLTKARELGARRVECRLDSELVVNQLKLKYKLKNPALAPWFTKIWNLKAMFDQVTFHSIPREQNHEADQLVNEAIDEGLADSRSREIPRS